MHKTLLIIRREYLTRVKKKSFLLATLLTPLGIAAFIAVASLIFGYESDDAKRVAVVDEAGVFPGGIKDEATLKFVKSTKSLEELKAAVKAEEFDGVLVIPKVTDLYAKDYEALFYTEGSLTLDVESALRERVRDAMREYRATSLGLDAKNLAALKFKVDIEPEPIDEAGEDTSSMTGAIGAGLGTMMGFAMYLVIFIYGMMVMRSVMEEKTTRIVEVMISSVKPFELMLGKIIGVGLVGLTQLGLWLILIPLIVGGAGLVFGFDSTPSMGDPSAAQAAAANVDPEQMQGMVEQMLAEINNLNWWAILPLFLIYFLGGYFLYASLFAAVGSVMGDDMGESQSLTIPITIPVILAIYIMFAVVQAPNSTLAMWSSQFPLFSPIVMPSRLAFNPPVWEVVLSVTILIATAIFFVWLSARVYRTGILLYGKKVGFKELGKWMVRG